MSAAAVSHVDFNPGSIKKIELVNFMTHQHLELIPSSRVNFVVGVNGSGKSSLVCAICLGLGGSTKEMSRASELASFVMKGKERAEVMITLTGRPEDHGDFQLKRVLYASKRKDEWFINNVARTAKDVELLVRHIFHVQMDNPCMFLPQEKVGDFTTLDPHHVMLCTMRAVAIDLEPTYDAIVKQQERLGKSTQDREKLLVQQQELQALVKNLERDKQKYEELQLLAEQLEVLKRRIIFAEMKETEAKLRTLEDELEAIVQEGKATEDILEAPRLAAEQARKAYEELQARSKITAAQRNKTRKELDNWNTQMTDAIDKVDDARGNLRSLQSSRDDRHREMEKLREVVAKCERELAELDARNPPPEVALQLKAANDKKTMLSRQHEQAKNEYHRAHRNLESIGTKLKALEMGRARLLSTRECRRKILAGSSFAAAARASRALEKLEKRELVTTGRVHGPVVLDIDIEPKYGRLFEMVIPTWLQFAFIASSADKGVLMSQSDISVVEINADLAAADAAHASHTLTPAQLAELAAHIGPVRYADELLGPETPAAVRTALCREARLNTVLVAENADAIEKFLRVQSSLSFSINSLCTSEASLRFRTSARGLGTSMSRIPIRAQAFYLERREDPDARAASDREIADMQAACSTARRDVELAQSKLTALSAEFERANTEHGSIDAVHKKRVTVLSQVNAQKKRLRELENAQDEEQKQIELKRALTDVRDAQLRVASVMARLPQLQVAAVQAATADVGVHFALERALDAKTEAERLLKEKQAAKKNYQVRLAEKKKEVDTCRAELDQARKEAEKRRKELANKCTGVEDPRRALAYWDSLGVEVEMLRAEIAEKEAEHKLCIADSEAVRKFKDAQDRLSKVNEQLAVAERDSIDFEERLQRLLTKWLTRMEPCVQSIHKVFSSRLAKLGVVGQVTLEYKEENLAAAGVLVQVAFRAGEQPQRLNKDIQSGGERALTTMMFLMALQCVARVPFRVVDEINQGVDANNERSLMETVTAITNDAETSSTSGKQLFIISPKLLPDLRHAEGMRTHVILNGPRVVPASADLASLSKVFRRWMSVPTVSFAPDLPADMALLKAEGSRTDPVDLDDEASDGHGAAAAAPAPSSAAVAGTKRRSPEATAGASGAAAAAVLKGAVPRKAARTVVDSDDDY